MVERYSDSAAAYVFLDSSNLPVYKQLYRAAKAKSKLKLRVTVLNAAPKSPKPVQVEDLPEKPATPSPKPRAVMPGSLPESLSHTNLPFKAVLAEPNFNSLSRDELRAKMDDIDARLKNLLKTPTPVSESISSRAPAPTPVTSFAVSCNTCERIVPDAHYHCSTCDDGDFDLCQTCIDQGITCHSDDHWLIRRTVVNGALVWSSTEKIPPKIKPASIKPTSTVPVRAAPPAAPRPAFAARAPAPTARAAATTGYVRTCNNCLKELSEEEFLHCDKCEDFDLCQTCFSKDSHGHHPAHGFSPAVSGTQMPDHIVSKLAPGRNKIHLATCDGCDKNISGVRHKCLDCADWDYCSDCMTNASFVHPSHRFVPIYEPLVDVNAMSKDPAVHMGTICDGPLCATAGWPSYILGVRYKCAVCHDVDFCANCESNPSNRHDKTHPMIKFSTPVRHVSVTTTGEQGDGKPMPTLGDKYLAERNPYDIFDMSSHAVLARLTVQPQEELVPGEPVARTEKRSSTEISPVPAVFRSPESPVEEPKTVPKWDGMPPPAVANTSTSAPERLGCVFIRETVSDGTIMAPNQVFEQTWVLRNEGMATWPAGCAVQYVGGDYMGHVDSAHPTSISELVSASKSTVCYSPLAPGQEFSFTVLLRSPSRTGKFISHWRPVTADGEKFGSRLWCEVSVRKASPPADAEASEEPKGNEVKKEEEPLSESSMIFPKLDKESPMTSMHEEHPGDAASSAAYEASTQDEAHEGEWDAASDDGFMTDEEYDILDASDEEYLEEHNRRLASQK